MKRYKIDFNNGKVFEATMCEEYYMLEEPDVNLTEEELLSIGATITEIEETRREFYIGLHKGATFVMEGKPSEIDYKESGPFEFYQQIKEEK